MLPLIAKNIVQALEQGRSLEAASLIHQVVSDEADGLNHMLQLGIFCASHGKLDEAIVILRSLADFNPDDIRIWYNLGLSYSLKGNHHDAVHCYRKALEINPQDIEALTNLSSSLNDLALYDESIGIVEQGLAINQELAELWSNYGIALNNVKQYEKAVFAYDQALKIDPQFFQAWSNRSNPLRNLNMHDEALASCDQAIKLAPDYAEAWVNRSIVLYEHKRFDEALVACGKAIGFKPDYFQAWLYRGSAQRELKHYEQALASYDQTIALKPDYHDAYYNRGIVYQELKLYDKALAEYDKAIGLKPQAAKCFYQKSLMNIALNEYDLATTNLEKAIEYNFDQKEHAEFVLSALRPNDGLKPMPHDFAAELFNDYADRFEKHLVKELKYQSPEVLLTLLDGRLTGQLNILDIGCGTGLMGRLLKPHAATLTGVDISKKMLTKAEAFGAYDHLVENDIGQFLRQCEEQFDLVVSADVFIYIGELDNIFKDLSRMIKKGGAFCFSVEKIESGLFSLSPKTLRFSHSRNYIDALASLHNFKIVHCLENAIRLEEGKAVPGYYFLLEKLSEAHQTSSKQQNEVA